MQAAVLRRHAAPPVIEERDLPEAPPGGALIDVRAAPISPLDVLCATGTSYFGPPALPYVPGVQGVGTVRSSTTLAAGTPVWFATNAGMQAGDGSLATVCAVAADDVVPLRHQVEPELVAALGLSAVAAWMALTWRGGLREGERVLVLAAGGVVGQVGLQVARLRGARTVIAGCRSDAAAERAARLGADAVVRLDTDDVDALTQRFLDAAGGALDLVLDPLCGVPASAALRALAPHGRLVNLGGSAGPSATLDSATVRSRSLAILGYTNNALTPPQRADALHALLQLAADGDLTVDHERVPFADLPPAWQRQAEGRADRRIVVAVTP